MLKVEYRDHIGFENKRLENEIHSRMTAYRAAMGGEELTMMQSWIIRFLYEHSEEDIYQRDIEAEFSIARSTATGILKLMEKSRQIGISWATAYAADERTAAQGARHDQWVSSRDDLQARLFIEDCKMWAQIMHLAAKDLGEVGNMITDLIGEAIGIKI